MKSTIHFLSAITLSLAAMGAQATSLSVGDNLMIESINGQVVDGQPVELNAGTHLVELRFSDRYYTNAGASGTWVQSGPLFTTVTVDSDETLSLTTPAIVNEAQAREYVRRPHALITSDTGRSEQVELNNHAALMSQLLAQK